MLIDHQQGRVFHVPKQMQQVNVISKNQVLQLHIISCIIVIYKQCNDIAST